MKCRSGPHQTGLLATGPCRAKPSPASPNHHGRCALFWDIMQHRELIHYQCSGTTYRSHLQETRNPQGRRQHHWS